jgi:nucleotide-binding universal stress UspA family protein
MFSRILLPIDDSVRAERSSEFLPLVAAADAQVLLLHVIDASARQLAEDTESILPVRREGRALLQRHSERVGHLSPSAGKWNIETELGIGDIHEVLQEQIQGFQPDLVAMGSQGRKGLSRMLFGSVTERFVRECPCPILVTKTEARVPSAFEKIVFATDFSPCAEVARKQFERILADAAPERRAGHVLHVVEADQELDVSPEEALDRVLAELRHDGLKADGRVAKGTPSECIAKLAEETDADLIVIGVHGRSAQSPGWLGSTMDRTLRSVSQPVLVVPERSC